MVENVAERRHPPLGADRDQDRISPSARLFGRRSAAQEVTNYRAPRSQALQHRSVKRTAVVFYAFDLLRLGETDYRGKPLSARRQALHQLKFAPPILLSTPLPGTPEQIERAVRKAGLEGVVAKRSESGLRVRPTKSILD